MTVFKVADDQQPHIDALTALLDRPDVDRRTRKDIEDEIWAIRLGRKGEAEAAYDIDFAYADRPNYVVLHDLRLEVGSRVAQIDHLILNRVLDLWVCETKGFSQGVKIDDQGYWRRYAGGRSYGMPSPVLQNENHIKVLRELFDSGAIDLPRRIVTLKPTYFPVVLLSNSAKLDLPRSRAARDAIPGLSTVMKSQELQKRILDSFDDDVRALRAMPKLVGVGTIEHIAHQLVAMHLPATFDWPAKFGLARHRPRPIAVESATPAAPATARPPCASCGRAVTVKVEAYLREHGEEFRGRMLCYDCQRRFRQAKAKGAS